MRTAYWGSLLGACLLSMAETASAQQCSATGANQTCTNSVALSGGTTGLQDTGTATIANIGGASIFGINPGGTATGIFISQNLGLRNFGTVSASGLQAVGISVIGDANIANSGTISALDGVLGYGISVGNNATIANTGTIAGSANANGLAVGVLVFNDADVTNSGTLSGIAGDNGVSYGLLAGRDVRLANSGTIIGTTGATGLSVAVRGQRNTDVTNSGTIAATGGIGSQVLGVAASTGTARVVNSGSLSVTTGAGGQSYGVAALGGAADVTNAGSMVINGGAFGFGVQSFQDATVNNSGTLAVRADQQSIGILAGRNAIVTNSGTLSSAVAGAGFSYGVAAVQDATVWNTGTISASSSGTGLGGGIFTTRNATVFNSGTISGSTAAGGQGFGIQAFGAANVTNSGTISGTLAALQFAGSADTLTVMMGSRIIGAINLGGGGDTVNFRGGNHNLTFDTLTGASVTGTTPFVVSGNRAVAIDTNSFASAGRTLSDFSRAVFDAVPVFFGGGAPGGAAPLAFAAPEPTARVDDAFAAMPGLSAYASEGLAFKNPTVVYGDGSAVWGRGFAGQRIQQQDGALLRTANLFYGGMIGGDWQTRPDLRLGVFLGGGQTRTSIDFNQGGSNTDLMFGGAYARYDSGASFLHVGLQAGGSRNAATRTINNNLLANGLEIASASFNGWYASPEATFGHRFALGSFAGGAYTLTPSLRLRYLYGSYAGYTETGTTAPLTVSGQTVSTLEERAEAKLTRSVAISSGSTLSTSITAGVLGTQRIGSNTINATLLGQAIPFATPGQANVWGGLGGLGLEWQTRNVTLFSTGEYFGFSDHSNIVSGRAGLRVAF